jgi:hypothetical protein
VEEEEDIIIIITVREREIRESYSSISHIILYVHIDVSVTFFLSCEKFFFFVERYGLTNRYEKKNRRDRRRWMKTINTDMKDKINPS